MRQCRLLVDGLHSLVVDGAIEGLRVNSKLELDVCNIGRSAVLEQGEDLFGVLNRVCL